MRLTQAATKAPGFTHRESEAVNKVSGWGEPSWCPAEAEPRTTGLRQGLHPWGNSIALLWIDSGDHDKASLLSAPAPSSSCVFTRSAMFLRNKARSAVPCSYSTFFHSLHLSFLSCLPGPFHVGGAPSSFTQFNEMKEENGCRDDVLLCNFRN